MAEEGEEEFGVEEEEGYDLSGMRSRGKERGLEGVAGLRLVCTDIGGRKWRENRVYNINGNICRFLSICWKYS